VPQAGRRLVEEYVRLRGIGGEGKIITSTPRQLESLIRLSEALARMRLAK
jgi:DNA replication licensing factor MCM4